MEPETESAAPKRKSRKKLLYQKIRQQMEFYFSPANLAKDRWLSNKLQEEDGIYLTEFLRFNKIKALTEDMNDLAKALRKSEILAVTEDYKVNRIQPIKLKENEEDYVIYVEQVPPDADHDWIKGMFSVYGDIDYVSIPRFKNSNKCKGFAFVEFSTVESAKNAIQDFRNKGNYLSTDIAPEELLSIANFEGDTAQNYGHGQSTQIDAMAVEGHHLVKTTENPRKRKNSEPCEEEQEEKKKRIENEEENATEMQDTTVTEDNSEVEESKTKKKKNRKKKSKKKKNKDSIDNFGFQILSKRDWKHLRNKYLNMQKEKMKQLKKHLFLAQKKSDPSRQIVKKKVQPDSNGKDKKNKLEISPMGFVPGVIVKIKFEEPIVEVKNLKNELKQNTSIKYVDVKEGESAVHLRFDSPEAASSFCENSSWPKTKVLKGQKEQDYWEKLQKQRNEKFSVKVTKKDRGKEKLMKKAEHILGKHIIFDEIRNTE